MRCEGFTGLLARYTVSMYKYNKHVVSLPDKTPNEVFVWLFVVNSDS